MAVPAACSAGGDLQLIFIVKPRCLLFSGRPALKGVKKVAESPVLFADSLNV